ncbi:MAG TPA: hypothetical protein VF117_00060 [Gammaproteobacteria bacterium]
MPLNAKGRKILRNMQQEYGTEKGRAVFYASVNKGIIKGVETMPRQKRPARKSMRLDPPVPL